MNHFRFYFIVLITMCFSAFCFGQNWDKKIDSINDLLKSTKNPNHQVDLINIIADHYRYVQLDEGLKYANKALELSQKNNYKRGIAVANYNLGANYFYQGEYKKSLEFYSKSLQIFKNLKDKKGISDTMAAISSVYVSLGDYNKSLEQYNKILIKYTDEKNNIGIAQTYSNIGTLYFYLNDKKKALEFYLKSSSEFKKANYTDNNFYSTTLTNIGKSYFDLKEYKKAESYFSESAAINNKIKNRFMVATNLCSIGDIHFEQNNLEEAEKFHIQSLEIGRQMNNQEVMAYNYGDLGRIYIRMAKNEKKNLTKNKFDEKAIEYLQTSTTIFKKTNNLNSYQQYTKYLAEAYENSGNHQKALEAFREHSIYKDSLFNEEKRKAFTRTELSFEFAKREDSIRFNNEKEIAIRDATLSSNKRQKWLLFGGIFILGSLGILLFYQNQSKKKTNKELSKLNEKLDEANQIKTRFFNILNHDLRSPISNIIKFIRLQQNNSISLDESTRNRLEVQTIDSAENLLNSMEDLLLWSKGQMQNFKPQPKSITIDSVFEDINRYFENVEKVTFNFINNQNLNLITDENYLKTILRNLTSNAVNALSQTQDPHITWEAKRENNLTILAITDNGPGGTAEQFKALYDEKEVVGIKTGLGLHLVRDMAKSIDCQISVETIKGMGTTIILKFVN